jgi:tRNA G37 N-methylase Trm5
MKLAFDPQLKGVKQLTEREKRLFEVQVNDVSFLKVKKFDYLKVKKVLKKYLLESYPSLKRYQDLDINDELHSTHKYILLDPESFHLDKLESNTLNELNHILHSQDSSSHDKTEQLIERKTIKLSYEDVKFDDVVKAVIPNELLDDNVNVKGYSIIGHIAHFNLRNEVLDYKYVIGN